MNRLAINTLKGLRRLYAKAARTKAPTPPDSDQDPDSASAAIAQALGGDNPCMIARFGSNELLCLVTWLGVKANVRKPLSYITGRSEAWWWNETNLNNMYYVAGFFPPTLDMFERFCELLLQDIREVDILGSWLANERLFARELGQHKKIGFELLNPYFARVPWTRALEGKKVLVVHPFARTIEHQYRKRELLFQGDLLPAFELKTIRAVQSHAGEATPFQDWFQALDSMKARIDEVDYDVCLIGAGAYGFSLAAHVKRTGKKAVHLGGTLQLLFGIRGKRWEDPHYNPIYNYARLVNEHWVRPSEEERPRGAEKVEGACYW